MSAKPKPTRTCVKSPSGWLTITVTPDAGGHRYAVRDSLARLRGEGWYAGSRADTTEAAKRYVAEFLTPASAANPAGSAPV